MVNDIAKEYQARVKCTVVTPEPFLTLVPGDEKPDVLHAILLISTKRDSNVIFNGTREHFFWPESAAIIGSDEFWHLYASEEIPEADIERFELQDFEKDDDGYWLSVENSLRQMLSDLD